VDLGAYNGDTVHEFVQKTDGKYKQIYALEPDKRNFKKLSKTTEDVCNINIFNVACWNEDTTLTFSNKSSRQSMISKTGTEVSARSVDSILDGNIATYIKYDVEGAEKQAIIGTENTIKKYSPKLLVALYHRDEDIFELPLLIKKLNPNYTFYLRHYPYIPAWEVNLFAI